MIFSKQTTKSKYFMTSIVKILKNVDKIFSIFDDGGPLIKFYFFHELKINYFFKNKQLNQNIL